MKKIDAHAHVGDFGGWAGVSITAKQLVEQMDAYEMEKTVLCSTDSTDNHLAAQAARAYPGRFWPLVYTNPLEGKQAVEQIYRYVEEEGFCGIKLQPLKHAYVADSTVVDPVMEAAEKPAPRRALWPLAADGSRVLWLWGAGFAEGTQPGPDTRQIIRITPIPRVEDVL